MCTVTMKHIDRYSIEVPKSLESHSVIKYEAPKDVLSDNGLQFASMLYQNSSRILGIDNTFTSAYQPQNNGQV